MGNEGSMEAGEGMAGYPEGMALAGMEADLSKLSDEERRQIAAVMSRAQEMPRGSPAERPALRSQNMDTSQSPRHPSKPPDPGPTGLSKSRTVDAFKVETKTQPPGRSPSTLSLKEPRTRPDIKEEQKTGMMSSFLSDSNPMNMVSSVVTKFNPFDAKPDSAAHSEDSAKRLKESENKGTNKMGPQPSQSPMHGPQPQGPAKPTIPSQGQQAKPIQPQAETKPVSSQQQSSTQVSNATKSLPHTPIPKEPLSETVTPIRHSVQEPKHTTSFPQGLGSKQEPIMQGVSAKTPLEKQRIQQSDLPKQSTDTSRFPPQMSQSEKQPVQTQGAAKQIVPQPGPVKPQQAGTATHVPQQETFMKQGPQQMGPPKMQGGFPEAQKKQAPPPSVVQQTAPKPDPTSKKPAMVKEQPPHAGKGAAETKGEPRKLQDDKMQVPKPEAKTMCPLCKTTELLLGNKEKPNYNTCTQCKTVVCSLCGFNPNPHMTEIHEWLCLNCQMQRALGMDVNSLPPPVPQPVKQKPATTTAPPVMKESVPVPDQTRKQTLTKQTSVSGSPTKSKQQTDKSKQSGPERKEPPHQEQSQKVTSTSGPLPVAIKESESKVADSEKTKVQALTDTTKQTSQAGSSLASTDVKQTPPKVDIASVKGDPPLSPKKAATKADGKQDQKEPSLSSSKPTPLPKPAVPVGSQSTGPGSPKSSPSHKPGAPQTSQTGSPKSSPQHKPAVPQTPGSPKPTPSPKPVVPQTSQSGGPGSPKPTPSPKPVAQQTSQSAGPGSPKHSPLTKPGAQQTPQAPHTPQSAGPGSPKHSPLPKPGGQQTPQALQSGGPGSPKPTPSPKPVAQQASKPTGPGSPKSSPSHKPAAPQTASQPPGSPPSKQGNKSSPVHKPAAQATQLPSGPGSPKSSPLNKPAAPQTVSQTTTQPQKPPEQTRRFSLNLGTVTDTPKVQPTTPQETVTGKLFGFGASIFSQASSFISTASQPSHQTQSAQGPAPKQPAPPPSAQGPAPKQPAPPQSAQGPASKQPAPPQSAQGPAPKQPAPPASALGPSSKQPAPPQNAQGPAPKHPGPPPHAHGPAPSASAQGPAASQPAPPPSAQGRAPSQPAPPPSAQGPAPSQPAPPPSAQVPAPSQPAPPQSAQGPAHSQPAPPPSAQGPAHSQPAPSQSAQGPAHSQPAPSQSAKGPASSQPAHPPSAQRTAPQQPTETQKLSKEAMAPPSPKTPATKNEIQPDVSKKVEETKSSSVVKDIDENKFKNKAAEKTPASESKTTVKAESMNKVTEHKTSCPLCKTELNLGSKDPPNYNTCTECKHMVCNLCGFNPTPHLTEIMEWLCLNCQTQRALSGQLGNMDNMPPALGLSPKPSPKHTAPIEHIQKPPPPDLKPISKATNQDVKKEIPKIAEDKPPKGPVETIIQGDNKDDKTTFAILSKEPKLPATFTAAETPLLKDSRQDVPQDITPAPTILTKEHEEMTISKQDLKIELSETTLKQVEGEKVKPEVTKFTEPDTGKEKTEKEDDKSDTSNSQQQKSPQGLSDTGYSSDGISGSLGEIPSLIPSDEKDLINKKVKKESFIHEISPSSPSDLAKLESTVLSILEAQTSVHADEKLKRSNELYGRYGGETQEKSKTKILPVTPDSYSSEDEDLDDINEEDEETMGDNSKVGLNLRKVKKDSGSLRKDGTAHRRHDSLDDSSESENSPIPQRKRINSNASTSSDDYKQDDSQGSGDDEDFIRKQIIEMSADEDASGSEDEEFIRSKLKEISSSESQKKENKAKTVTAKTKRLTKTSSSTHDEDGVRRHSWHDDDEEDEDEEKYDETPKVKHRETKSQESEELSSSTVGGLRRFKTIELNSTTSTTYTEDPNKPSTALYYDIEPELEMESLTDSPEDRSREERSSSLHASSFTPGTSPTSVSSLDEDSDSSPSHKKISGESKHRKSRHRTHGPALPTIEDSSEEEELREEEELLKEQEIQREIEQQQRRGSSKKSKKDKDELRAQRRRERPKTPPSNLSPIEDASPTEELRQAAEMEELHRSSCSEYSPSIESEPEGFEISPEKILEVQKVYKLPTAVSLYSPTDVSIDAGSESKTGQQVLKSAEEAYEDIVYKAKLYQTGKEKEEIFEKEPLYGGMLIEDYIYESLVEESYDESLESDIISSHDQGYQVKDMKTSPMGDICIDVDIQETHFTTETFHTMVPQEDIISSSYIVPESHEIINLDNTDERPSDGAATGSYDLISCQNVQLTPGSSPTQHKTAFASNVEPVSFITVDMRAADSFPSAASVESSTPHTVPIPDVKITQHFTAEVEDDAILDYSPESTESVSEEASAKPDLQLKQEPDLVSSKGDVSFTETAVQPHATGRAMGEHVTVSVTDNAKPTDVKAPPMPMASEQHKPAIVGTEHNLAFDMSNIKMKEHKNSTATYFEEGVVVPMSTESIVSTKHTVTSTAVTDTITTAPKLQSVISTVPSVTSKVMSFFRSTPTDTPVSVKSSTPSPPPPPPPPLPPATPPKPVVQSKKRPAPKIPSTATTVKTSTSVPSTQSVQVCSASISTPPLVSKPQAPPPPVPPKPSTIPAGLVFSHKTVDLSKSQKVVQPVHSNSHGYMQKKTEAEHKMPSHSSGTSFTLNLVTATDYVLPSPTSPLSPHSNKSSPRLTKPSQETYVVITLPSEPGTPTDNDTAQMTTCWPQTSANVQTVQSTETVFSTAPYNRTEKVPPYQLYSAPQIITKVEAESIVTLPENTAYDASSSLKSIQTEKTEPEKAKVTEPSDVMDLRTMSKVEYKSVEPEADTCMDLSSTTVDGKHQPVVRGSVSRPISAVQPAIVNLSTASPVISSVLLATESVTIVTCSTTVSYTTSLESLVDIGSLMTEPLKLTTTRHFEGEHKDLPGEVEVPINLSTGVPAYSVSKPFSVSSTSVLDGCTAISTSQESVDSGVVDLSTTKSLRTMVTMDETSSAIITEIIEDDDKPVDLTAGRRAVCCDVVYKLPFGRSCISQQTPTTLPEDRFGYRDDHYQYDRSALGFRGIGSMKPSMSDTNLADAGLFLYRSKNTFDYPVGVTDVAVDLTSGKVTTGETLDYNTKTTGAYPETRQVISGLGISTPQYSQARIDPSLVPAYAIGSVLRSSNGVVYSSVASPVPSTFAITTQPGSIFSTAVSDLSCFINNETITSSLNQTQPLPRTYSIYTSVTGDTTDVMSVVESTLQTFPVDAAVSTQADLVSIMTSESEAFPGMTEDESFLLSEEGDQALHLQRELLELEKLKQQRLAEELEWERQEIQRFREQETFMVQKKLEELQSMKQHLLYQQEEERQAQYMMRQETLAQQQIHLEQIQQLQQQLHQQIEEQKLRQIYQFSYDPDSTQPQTTSEQVILENQYSAPEDGQFWTVDHIVTTSAAAPGIEMVPNEAWYTVQSDGVTQYIPRAGIMNSVSEMSLKDADTNAERQLKKRSSMPRLGGMYDESEGGIQEEPRSYKMIADSGVQTDDEDSNENRYTSRRRKSKKGVDTSVQTDDEDQEEWEMSGRSRRRRTGKYPDGTPEVDKSRQYSKVSSIAVQTVAETSVQTEPLGTIKMPSIRAKIDSKVEIVKHISAPEKSYRGGSLGCQTETDSDGQSTQYMTDASRDKRRPSPLDIGYSSHLRADSSLQVAPSPPKSPKVLYSPISPVSPSKALESAFVPYDTVIVDDISTHKQHTEIPPPSPKTKVMQRSLSDPKPLSPTSEDLARAQFQYSDGYSTIQGGTQKKVKRTLPNPPPEEANSGLQSPYGTVGSVSRRRICRTTTMARAKILQDIDRELDLVERESSKLRKKQAELDEEEKEIDAKLRYLEMGINRRKEALLKEREKRERAYLQGVAEERDYMSDSEVSSTRPTRIESHLGLDRPQTAPQPEYSPYLPPQTQTDTQFAPQTSPYTQYQYQTPTLLTQAPTQFPQQSHYQPSLYHQQVSSYQTQPTYQAVPTMSFTPQPPSTLTQPSSYQHPSQLLLLKQKARQGPLDLEPKIPSHYDVIRNQPLIIAPASTDSSYSHLGSKYSTLDLRLGLDEKSSMASSPMSSISGDSFYADLEHHASRNYVLIDDIGELTKGTGSISSTYGLHEKELSKTDCLLRTVDSRRTPEVTDFLAPISSSARLHSYGKAEEDSMEDPYELKLLKHQIKQEFRRGTDTLDPLAGYSSYYHSDSLYRHFPKSEKYSISRLTLEKQAAKQLPPSILYQKQSKPKKSIADTKILKFSPIQENRDLEPDYSTYLSSSTSSIPSISTKVRMLQDDITYGLRKNITDQQKYLAPTLTQNLGTSLNTNLRVSLQDEVDKPYVSGNRSRPSSRPSSVYGLDLSIKRDLSSSSLRQKANEAESIDGTFSHAAPSGRTKPTSLPISQSRGRIPIVAQNSEEESPLSPVGQPMGMARAAAGPLPPISADTRDQFGSSHSLPEVQQHMREESRTRGYDRDLAFIMDDFQHAMSDSEENSLNDAYHLRREETDWFDKPRESRLDNGHGLDRKMPDKLSHGRSSYHQDQMNGKPIHYPFPHSRMKLQRDPKDHTVSGNGFGIRVVGGKEVPGSQGEIGAYIAKILPGGGAEQTGRLTEGMQVLEWNGFPLTAKTYEEVQSIISQSSGEAEICIRLDINMLSSSQTPQNYELHEPAKGVEKTRSPGVDPKQLAAELQKVSQQQTPAMISSALEKGSYIHSGTTSAGSSAVPSPGQPGSPSVSKKRHSSKSTEAIKPHPHPITGEIQLQVNYDKHLGNLIIHILQARNLVPRDNNGYSDPFVKVYLLPGRGQVMVVQNASAEYKRRTKYVQKSLNPEWNQTVIYKNISMEQIKKKTLEVTVWDYDRFSSNDFLGEVLIDLSNAAFLDNMPRWYPLKEQSESIDQTKHSGQSNQQSPKPSVIKSRSHGIFPDPAKDMQVPTIEKSHSSPGSSKSSSEGHLRSHGPSRSQSKGSVTQTHLEDAGAAIAAAEAAVQQHRLQPTNDSKDQSQLALKKVVSDGSVKNEVRTTSHSTTSTTSSTSSFGNGYNLENDGGNTQGENNVFQVPRIGKITQNGQDQIGMGLTEAEGKTQVIGEIKIALKKEMKTDGEQLIVEILQCRNITYKFKSPDHLPDLYVKLYVINIATQKRIIKKKTRVCRHDREPSFNETFRFSMSPAGHSLQILLASNGGKFIKKTLIGEAYISLDKVDLRKRIVNWHKLLASSVLQH